MNESKAVAILIDNSATSIDGDFYPNRLTAQLITAGRYAQHLFSENPNNQVAIGTLGDTEFGIRASFTTSLPKIESIFNNIVSSGSIDLERGLKSAILALHHCNNVTSQNQQSIQPAWNEISPAAAALKINNNNNPSPSKQTQMQQHSNSYENNNNNDFLSTRDKDTNQISKHILAFVGNENNITDENKSDIAKRLSEEDISLYLVIIGENVSNQQILKDLVNQIKPELKSQFWPIPNSSTILADDVISLAIKLFNPDEMFRDDASEMYRDDPAIQDAIKLSKNGNINEIKHEEKAKSSQSVKTKVPARRIKCVKNFDQPPQQQQQIPQQLPQQQIISTQRQPVHIVHQPITHLQARQPPQAPIQPIKIIQQQQPQQPQQIIHTSSSSPQSRSLSPQQQPQQIQIVNGMTVSHIPQQQLIYQIGQYSQIPQIQQMMQYPHIQQQQQIQAQRPIVLSTQIPLQQPINTIGLQQIQQQQMQLQQQQIPPPMQQIQQPQIPQLQQPQLQQIQQPQLQQTIQQMHQQQIQQQYQQQIQQQQQYQQYQQQIQQQQQQQYQQQIQQQQPRQQKKKPKKGASKNPKDP